jgi:ABC-type Fe3+ transport system substrate-binding protein
MRRYIGIFIAVVFLSIGSVGESAWQEEWDKVLKAARQEGEVAVSGPAGVQSREALTKPFTDKFGIKVNFFGASGRAIAPRIMAERRARQYRWDIFVHGTTTGLTVMVPAGAFQPLRPALILPEVTDAKHWRGGGLEILGKGAELGVMTPFQRGTIFYNTKMVDPKEFKSYKDLLDPKWKGELAVDDPTRPGPGQATFTFFYLHPELGPDFIRALAKQDLRIQRDYTVEGDDLGHGRFPVLIGTADFLIELKMKKGLPIGIIDPRQLREGSDVSPANGAVAIYKGAPHPNAAKVYINWLLSRDGQRVFPKIMGYVSARNDVPTDHTFEWRVPQPGAIKTYDERAMRNKKKVISLVQSVFRRRR